MKRLSKWLFGRKKKPSSLEILSAEYCAGRLISTFDGPGFTPSLGGNTSYSGSTTPASKKKEEWVHPMADTKNPLHPMYYHSLFGGGS